MLHVYMYVFGFNNWNPMYINYTYITYTNMYYECG